LNAFTSPARLVSKIDLGRDLRAQRNDEQKEQAQPCHLLVTYHRARKQQSSSRTQVFENFAEMILNGQ
jgi:hypothetical protein